MYSLDFRRFDSAEVDYNPSGKYVSIKFLKESRSEDYKALWSYAISLKHKYNTIKWLFDKTLENIYPNDDKWKKNILFKETFEIAPINKENPRFAAIIMPLNFYTEVVTKEYLKEKNNQEGYNFKIFKSDEEAKAWLCEQEDPRPLKNSSETNQEVVT